MALALGVDLGTTTSVVSWWDDAGGANAVPLILADETGSRSFPSMIAYAEGSWLFGNAAKQQEHRNSQNTVHSFKLLLGRTIDSSCAHVESAESDC